MDDSKEDVKEEAVETEEASSMQSYDRSDLPNLLRIYYTWLFPYDKYFQWLQYGKHPTYVPYRARVFECSVLPPTHYRYRQEPIIGFS